MMICWISSKLLNFVCKNYDIPSDTMDIYQYVIEITISSMLNITLVLLCAVLFGDIFSGIVYLLIFIFSAFFYRRISRFYIFSM